MTLAHNFADLLQGTGSVMPFSTSMAMDKPADPTLSDLQQRILKGNFAEPRSLIGGLVPPQTKKALRRQNAFDYGKADTAIKATAKFNLELETVPERVNDKKSNIDLLGGDKSNHKSRRDLSKSSANVFNSEAKIKQLINGAIVAKGNGSNMPNLKTGLADILGFSADSRQNG